MLMTKTKSCLVMILNPGEMRIPDLMLPQLFNRQHRVADAGK
jgi:hypothetical protein